MVQGTSDHPKEVKGVVEMWTDLESITQSEVSQEEKNKYHILTHMESRKKKMVLMNLFAGQRCREWTCGHMRGRGGQDKVGE